MERSAIEALIIGLNVFVFVIALTAGITLMTNIMDMSNYANEIMISGMNGSIAESIGQLHERTYKGYEVLKFYRNTVKEKNDDVFYVQTASISTPLRLELYIASENVNQYINKTFELIYKGQIKNAGKYVNEYVFLAQ